jgi:hypothetical protein
MDFDVDHVDYDIEDKHILVDRVGEDVYMVQFYNSPIHNVNLNHSLQINQSILSPYHSILDHHLKLVHFPN